MTAGFHAALAHIRAAAGTEAAKGRLFERLIKRWFELDPLYADRFARVSLWREWAAERPGFDGRDTGIDIVAEERGGGVCAVQCKCYAPDTPISKPDIDSFIAASNRDPFTARILVHTADKWGANAEKTVRGLNPRCQVLRPGDLASRPFRWPDLVRGRPEDLAWRGAKFAPRPHQQEALDDTLAGFAKHDRGKLVMACGTGKTYVALRIAEAIAGVGGRALYLVPSISLFAQAMREWATQRALPHRYIGVCSDEGAGRGSKREDARLEELEIPVTTDPAEISRALRAERPGAMTAVFCTYHSLGLVERAQNDGAPPFDLVLCDEAHRTTGVERPGDRASHFVLIHDPARIRAGKRLYMTATPRLYTAGAKARAARRDAEVFSMDDAQTYGPEFHRLTFSSAVSRGLLSDYKVVILTLSERAADPALQAHLAARGGEIDITDTAKIVGCWRALSDPENRRGRRRPAAGPVRPLARAIAFTNTIAASRRLTAHWAGIVERAVERLPEAGRAGALRCETRHVDGQTGALDRAAAIEWLEQGAAGACRVLSNARCLTEGIDAPALDAVLFMSPRNSQIDIVQAVGRVMRAAPGKENGYIVLPVAVPAADNPGQALDRNERFAAVWGVLNALRSHDERFNAEIARIDLHREPPERIILAGGDGEDEDGAGGESGAAGLPFPPLDLPPEAIFAKIVEKCGDRRYWESWAADVADIFARLVMRIEGLLAGPGNETLGEWFGAFHEELRTSINDSITRAAAIDMMAQHIITRPVFEALFEGYDFARSNPVAKALDELRRDFGEFGLENETRDLRGFYESVRLRARGLTGSAARQGVLMELYQRFFARAMKKDADRLGIVYTPVEVVDFILHSADRALRDEFGRGLTDEDVHVLDPFTGTGVFPARLLQSGLIAASDLPRKYARELHANEIVLLAYYIAAIHIEEAFHGRRGGESAYEPFPGIALTDTFTLREGRGALPKVWLPGNSDRVERQQKAPIQVIVGNPPWSAGQRSAADENPNVDYPALERRVAETWVARSTAANKNSLYDTYKMAIRWASDRIGAEGVIAFVTNGSWIDGNADSGLRACLAEEFSTIYVLNLRGNARTSGPRRRAEGDNIFGQGSRAPVAITILVRNPNAAHKGCRILYRDIGDGLKREDKLEFLRKAGSIAGVADWQAVEPDAHNDWIGKRSAAFRALYPLGTKAVKAGASGDAVFALFGNGYKTGRDAYMYNFSREACAENARRMVNDYRAALAEWEKSGAAAEGGVEGVTRRHSAHLQWDDKLKNNLRRKIPARFANERVRRAAYRPFVAMWCYADDMFVQRPARTAAMFPAGGHENRAICVPTVGSTVPFSALITDTVPDLHFIAFGQCFPRYRWRRPAAAQTGIPGVGANMERIDNITDAALRAFRAHYADPSIDKDAIFDYVYGALHAPEWRKRFANDLAKELPRIPFAADFHAFARAGRSLAALHLGYETAPEYPLELEFAGLGPPQPDHFRLGPARMRFAGPARTALRINEHITLQNIPAEAHRYTVNGRTPLEWLIDRYRQTRDPQSGLANDPNASFPTPEALIPAIRRAVRIGVDTAKIVSNLPAIVVARSASLERR